MKLLSTIFAHYIIDGDQTIPISYEKYLELKGEIIKMVDCPFCNKPIDAEWLSFFVVFDDNGLDFHKNLVH